MLYNQVCDSWRALTDVRFKLLGIVPTVSALVLINLLGKDEPSKGLAVTIRMEMALFGLLITTGLAIYDMRNSELYDDLISRGRKIEEELGVATGQFLGRKKPSSFLINHSMATNLIYSTAIVGWSIALVDLGFGWYK